MRFWDSSALVALLVPEADTPQRVALLREDPEIVLWWATAVECESALQRRLREGVLSREQIRQAHRQLEQILTAAHEVIPSPSLRTLAQRLLRTHPLRAADALQLAAALTLQTSGAPALPFVCADARLRQAAEIEGLQALA